jgi:hypothetical protein
MNVQESFGGEQEEGSSARDGTRGQVGVAHGTRLLSGRAGWLCCAGLSLHNT